MMTLGNGKRTREEIELALQNILMEYRNTPHRTTGNTPVEMLTGRKPRDVMSLLHPIYNTKEKSPMSKAKQDQVASYKGNRKTQLQEGEPVMVRDFSKPHKPGWQRATVQTKLGQRHYQCKLDSGHSRKCNIEQMIRAPPKDAPERPPDKPGRRTITKPKPRILWWSPTLNIEDTAQPEANPERTTEETPQPMIPADREEPVQEEPRTPDASGHQYVTPDVTPQPRKERETQDDASEVTVDEPEYPNCPVCDGVCRSKRMVQCTRCDRWTHYE